MSKCKVITKTGLQVYAGRRDMCYVYVMQALGKGSKPGFLRIVEEENDVLGQADGGISGHGAHESG